MRRLGVTCFVMVALFGLATAENSVLRLHLPPPAKFEAWAAGTAAPWSMFVSYPTLEGLDEFLVFLHLRFVSYDVPTLYMLMQQLWLVISPLGSKGASRQATTALAFTCVQVALTICRLRSVMKSDKWPRWFQHVWKALPEAHRHGISTASFTWFQMITSWCKGEHGSSAVYIFFTHAATYIGKANTTRKPIGLASTDMVCLSGWWSMRLGSSSLDPGMVLFRGTRFCETRFHPWPFFLWLCSNLRAKPWPWRGR